jgi:hypothetical protein
MLRTTIAGIILLLVLPVCGAANNKFDFQKRVGLVSALGGGHVLSIDNESLTPGTRLLFCGQDSSRTTLYGSITGKYTRPKNDFRPFVNDNISGNSVEPVYTIEADFLKGTMIPFAVAVVLDNHDGSAAMKNCDDLDRDGVREYFSGCASHEGDHTIIRTGDKKTGKKRWHVYYYFGYTIESNCTVEMLK